MRGKSKVSFYVQKNEAESVLVSANKSLPNLNISLMQECQILLHKDFLMGLSPFEYLIDSLKMDNLIRIA